jgi:hypothetical protein
MRIKQAIFSALVLALATLLGVGSALAQQKSAPHNTDNRTSTVQTSGNSSVESSDNRTNEKTSETKSTDSETKPQPKSDSSDAKDATRPSTDADRIRALEDALQQQNVKLLQMQKLIEEQQRMMQQINGKAATANDTHAETAASAATPASNSVSSDTAATATPAQQQPSMEDRLKKVEERVTKIGPVRLSGDFRLRWDGTFRKATEPPDPALQHVQNARVRYRLRLNMDTELNSKLSFHGQLTTGPFNNALTLDQDFTSTVARHPFLINEAWVDYHPNKTLTLQGGRVQEVFADNSRFIFDDDVRFNGFNEKLVFPIGKKGATVELRAGQYWFSNPNVALITAGSPLAVAGDEVGTIGRSSNLFHQGLLFNIKQGEHWTHQFGGDVQVFREPNQIQLASTANGVVFIVQGGLGVTLSGPLTGTGNATTTNGGAIYTAEDFHIGRITYRLGHTGFKVGDHAYPVSLNLQVARNFGTDNNERDAMLAAFQVGRPTKLGDMSFLYAFAIKGANSIISQLTDDDLGTGSGVNIRTHYLRWELGLARNVTLQSLVFIQNELRNSGQFPNFFVPLNAFTPRQYRFQEQMVFSF